MIVATPTSVIAVPDFVRPRSRKPVTALRVIFPAVLLWAVFESYWRLSVPPMLFDEGTYQGAGWHYLHWSDAAPHDYRSNFEHPPLAKLLFGVAQDLAGHPSVTAARAVAASCTLAAGLVLGLWLWRVAGPWVGLLAGAAQVLVPTVIVPQVTSLGRDAMLDPVAAALMIGSVAAAWFWFRAPGTRAWSLAALTGIAVGLAAAGKENGFLGAVGP